MSWTCWSLLLDTQILRRADVLTETGVPVLPLRFTQSARGFMENLTSAGE